MRILRKLRTFNTIAFAVLVVLLIAGVLFLLAMAAQSYSHRNDDYLSSGSSGHSSDYPIDERRLNFEAVTAEGRSLLRFGTGLNGDRQDLGFVDMTDGNVHAITTGDETVSTLEDLTVGETDAENKGRLVGWLAYRRVKTDAGPPRFDVLAGRYSDMRQFVVAKNVETYSPDTALSKDMVLSAVVSDRRDEYRVEKFDLMAGKIVFSRSLKLPKDRSMPRSLNSAPAKPSDLAPANGFH